MPSSRPRLEIELLRQFEPEEGYYLACSFGKDSMCVKALCDMAEVKYETHYNVTTIDPPELVHFGRKLEGVTWNRPERHFLNQMKIEKMPPLRWQRWCCRIYKEGGGVGRTILTGIRAAESHRRGKRKRMELCINDPSKRTINPIFDWTEDDVWNFTRENDIPYCSLYDEGYLRLGCLFCPMKSSQARVKEAKRWPNWAEAFMNALDEVIEIRKEEGKKCTWKDGEEFFFWWIESENDDGMFSGEIDA